MPDGKYDLGGQEVEKKGNECRLTDSGNLAGSVTNYKADCIRYAVKHMEVPLKQPLPVLHKCSLKVLVWKDYGSILREKGKFLTPFNG